MNFKVGDKVIIDFNALIVKLDIPDYDKIFEAKTINENKIFTVKRIPNNNSIELTEDIKPYSNYIVKEYLISIKETRKEKLNEINESNLYK